MANLDEISSCFSDLYKYKTRYKDQQSERRLALLEEQKRLRQVEIDNLRPGLAELIEAETSDREGSQCPKPRRWVSKFYRDKLQLSEWMYERPDDLENWILVPCPTGTRCLLVVRRGYAVAFDKKGYSVTKIPLRSFKQHGITVIDCFITRTHIIYPIDLLVYNNTDLVQCDCQFRFLWLRSKLDEEDKLLKALNCANWKLVVLPMHDFAVSSQIEDCLSRYPMFNEEGTRLDGLLFYHKESNYIYGQTPLVTWLFPFMVPDILDKSLRDKINHHYLARMPARYAELGARAYMDEFDSKLLNKRLKRSSKMQQNSMDLGEGELGLDQSFQSTDLDTQAMDGTDEECPDELDAMRKLECLG